MPAEECRQTQGMVRNSEGCGACCDKTQGLGLLLGSPMTSWWPQTWGCEVRLWIEKKAGWCLGRLMGMLLILRQTLDEDIKSPWPYGPTRKGITLFKLDDRYFGLLYFGWAFTQPLHVKLSEQKKRRPGGANVDPISYSRSVLANAVIWIPLLRAGLVINDKFEKVGMGCLTNRAKA